jgi:hypothetical protein
VTTRADTLACHDRPHGQANPAARLGPLRHSRRPEFRPHGALGWVSYAKYADANGGLAPLTQWGAQRWTLPLIATAHRRLPAGSLERGNTGCPCTGGDTTAMAASPPGARLAFPSVSVPAEYACPSE